VYAFGGFILTAAIIQKTKQSMAIFFLVLLIYGGFFWGLLPVDPKVSWQGHISGLIVGAVIARWKVRQWLPSIPGEMELRDGDDNQETGELEDPYIHI
jgi:membrane associated rhomboid family serine protease